MRPERLELNGFGVFRDPTVVDFSGADLIAFSGPTGSGKSTIIDAIVFALYGSVPRYDNKSLVAPVISQGKVEAQVRLDFTVAGQWYRAVRVVRASGKGATTKEARLERIERPTGPPDPDEPDAGAVEVLAGNADELTAEVERLLGLTYEHFTTCVVLPQGDFQRFLHQKPSARQDLLVELLDLGVYGTMAQLAGGRAKDAQHQRAWLAQQLADLAGYTPEQRVAIETELATLEKLLLTIDDAGPAIEALARTAADAVAASDAATARVALLAGVREPAGLAALADDLASAADAVADATTAEDAAAVALAAAEAVLDAAPDRAALDAAVRDHAARATTTDRIAEGERVVLAAVTEEGAAERVARTARAAHDKAVLALDDARRVNRAHEFAAVLAVGAPCPVCLQTVGSLLAHDLGDLDALVAAERIARLEADDADATRQAAVAARTRGADLLDSLRERVAELDEQLAAHPDLTAVEQQLAAIDEATTIVKQRRADEQAARKRRQAAEKQQKELAARELAARREFDETRDRVALLGPPLAARTDLAADWRALLAWVEAERPAQQAAADDARDAATGAVAERARRAAEIDDACAAAGVEPAGRPPRDVVVEYLSNTRADLESLDGALERASELRSEDARLDEAEKVAAALANHLRSTGFEKWVLDEVLHRLVAGATEILFELSGGTYSLDFDTRSNFVVIDHANADARRSARTLSGGETFLAALALALALADEVAQLAAMGSVRLESIFLDEGFGTLDPATLDTVASAIEELGASGRLVGLVTHVRDLAERLPVRFEMTRQGNASTVARVDQ